MNVNRLPVNVRRYGSPAPLPERIQLRAGPLSLVLEGSDLRYIIGGGREIVRRIYVAVRDQNWNTIAPQLSDFALVTGEDHFRATFQVAHQQNEIDFRWRGEITGEPDGTITYTMDGEAHSTFLRNRIGCCVLHPPHECSGQTCTVENPEGYLTQGRFPTYISPHQPFIDLRAITYEIASGARIEVRCEGDIFEMEDQRNWSDASFKTYSTPLSLPRPAEVQQGTKIKQKITLKLHGELPSPAVKTSEISISFNESSSFALPRLGLCLPKGYQTTLSEVERKRLQALRLSHLRFDLNLSESDFENSLQQAADAANQIGAPLELALFLTDSAEEELKKLVAALSRIKVSIRSVLIFHQSETSTSGQWIELAKTHLRPLLPGARYTSGTNNYFTEINRERPPVKSLDAICYSLNPQVHSVDHTSVMENLAAQTATALSARQFAEGKDVAITPITLKPRFNPNDKTPGITVLPSSVDVRQMSLFGAAWTLGSLRYVTEGEAASATYYETTGWRGVMESHSNPPNAELFPSLLPSLPGSVFPLYHVLADVCEYASYELIPAQTDNHDLQVTGFKLKRNDDSRIMLANLTPETQHVRINALPETVRLKLLDETNVERAMIEPEAFRAETGEERNTKTGELTIELLPYAVARLDH